MQDFEELAVWLVANPPAGQAQVPVSKDQPAPASAHASARAHASAAPSPSNMVAPGGPNQAPTAPKLPTVAWINPPTPDPLIQSA
jgi:hypothetical protein